MWTGALTARATNRYHKAPLPYPPVERSSRPAMVSLNAGLGTLAARAYELLDAVGHPVAEERLVQHVFGLTGLRRPQFWRGQLTRLLAGHDLFTQLPDGSWALAAWLSASATLRSLRYVVVDVETTGLSPRTQTLIEIAALRCLGAQAAQRGNLDEGLRARAESGCFHVDHDIAQGAQRRGGRQPRRQRPGPIGELCEQVVAREQARELATPELRAAQTREAEDVLHQPLLRHGVPDGVEQLVRASGQCAKSGVE